MSAAASALLDIQDLRTQFATERGIVRAVDGVSLQVVHGETLGIVGESGCGKSVLARSLMRLLPPAPHSRCSGKLLFDGRDLLSVSERELTQIRGRDIAMVFQDPMTSLNPVLTIGEQLVQVLRRHNDLSRRAAADRAVELLAQVNIPAAQHRAREYPHHLSGGMRQRVVIAIALACSPRLLIADEPTTALDVTVQAQILDLLQQLQTEHRMSLILISHNFGVINSICDRVAVMYAGRIVEEATTQRLFESPRMRYTQALLQAVPRLDTPSHSALFAIEGRPPNLLSPPPGCRFAPRCTHSIDACANRAPELTQVEAGHRYACWNPQSLPTESL